MTKPTVPNFGQARVALVALILLASCSTPVTPDSAGDAATPSREGSCIADRASLLALDFAAFDQDPTGGWRAVANRSGCMTVAADLIRDYHAALPEKSYLLYWHEGQVRAIEGDYPAALPLFEKAHNQQSDTFGWNLYVDATIAFLKRDRTGLAKAWFELANLPIPSNLQLDQNRNAGADSWPPNVNVVQKLLACFDQSYREAYQNCRP